MIRAAAGGDHLAISALLSVLGYPAELDDLRERLARLSNSPDYEVLVAVCAEEIVGMSALHRLYSIHHNAPSCRIIAFAVAPEHQQSGVGRALVEASERSARAWDCDRLELTSSNIRKGAHAFYEHVGFISTKRHLYKDIEH